MTTYLSSYSPAMLEQISKYCNLKNNTSFNITMFHHYEALFNSYRYGWNFIKAFFMWRRMKYYQERMERCQVQDLLKDLNKGKHVSITV